MSDDVREITGSSSDINSVSTANGTYFTVQYVSDLMFCSDNLYLRFLLNNCHCNMFLEEQVSQVNTQRECLYKVIWTWIETVFIQWVTVAETCCV